jgi:hypothetical protein
MKVTEAQPMPEPTPPSTAQADRWNTWFWRAMQIVGAAIIIEQLIVGQGTKDRPWMLLVGLALILGAFGVQLGLRAALRIIGGGGQR